MIIMTSILEPLGTSALVVGVAEIGDKTQLLAIVLAARFGKPLPIILGILCATLLNHAGAATLGFLATQWLSGSIFQAVIGIGFLVMAGWALIPDKDDVTTRSSPTGSVFLTTLVAFFLVEIGDKTQIATSLLAARFSDILLVTAGTTAGMMIANVPAIFLGEALTRVVPLKWIRIGAALLFAALGVWVTLDAATQLFPTA
jgi:Ca2+/H+ antiporter, TMEM165/GDT1 family